MPPPPLPRLSRLPPGPAASTVPCTRSRARGCTVRREDEDEARDAAAAAAAGRPAPRGRCPRGCSRALRGALGRGRRRLSSPPEPGLASQRLNSQTSIMAAASERREPSAAAARRPGTYPAAVHKESRHITARRPARPLRRRRCRRRCAGSPAPGCQRGGGRRARPRRGREGRGGAGAAAPGASAEPRACGRH